MSPEDGFVQQWGHGQSEPLTEDSSLNGNLSSYRQFARSKEVGKSRAQIRLIGY